jgi:hypothetical protein
MALSLKIYRADLHLDLAKALEGTMMRVNSKSTYIHKPEGTLIRLIFHT